jgi:hypothetical protein
MTKLEIRPAAFDCKRTQVMGEAYDKTCLAMRDWEEPEAFKEIIAKRIYRNGVRRRARIGLCGAS